MRPILQNFNTSSSHKRFAFQSKTLNKIWTIIKLCNMNQLLLPIFIKEDFMMISISLNRVSLKLCTSEHTCAYFSWNRREKKCLGRSDGRTTRLPLWNFTICCCPFSHAITNFSLLFYCWVFLTSMRSLNIHSLSCEWIEEGCIKAYKSQKQTFHLFKCANMKIYFHTYTHKWRLCVGKNASIFCQIMQTSIIFPPFVTHIMCMEKWE